MTVTAGSQDDESPTDPDHASRYVRAPVYAHTLPMREKPYAESAPMAAMMSVAARLTQIIAVAALAMIMWVMFGYSLAFGGDGKYIGNFDFALMKDLATLESLPGYTGDFALVIPIVAFFAFQMMFAVITPAIISCHLLQYPAMETTNHCCQFWRIH